MKYSVMQQHISAVRVDGTATCSGQAARNSTIHTHS